MSDENSLISKTEKVGEIYRRRILDIWNNRKEEDVYTKLKHSHFIKLLSGERKLVLDFRRKKDNLCRLVFSDLDYSEDKKLKLSLNADFFNPFFWVVCSDEIEEINQDLNQDHTVLDYKFRTYFDMRSYDPIDTKYKRKLREDILEKIENGLLNLFFR